MGDEGVFWVNTVYNGIGGFQVTLFRSKKYGECKLVSLTEFEQKFKVVEVILEQIKA